MLLLEVTQLFPDAFEALHGELCVIVGGRRRIRDRLGNGLQIVKEGVCLLACTGRVDLGADYIVLYLGFLLRDLGL